MCKYYYVHVWHLKPFSRWTLPRLRLGFLDGLSIFLDVMTTYTCVKRVAELIQVLKKMKKFINSPENVVDEAIKGFVGKNALTGAVCGDVFASPPSSAITSAVNATSGDGSVSQLEMGVLKSEIISWLLSNGYDVQCLIFGTLMTSIDAQVIKNALGFALKSVEYYAGAKPGHRTLVDPLNAAANYPGENWNDIAKAVDNQAKETAKMEAKAGRASYTDKSQQMAGIFEIELTDRVQNHLRPSAEEFSDMEDEDNEYENVAYDEIPTPPPSSSYINGPEVIEAIELGENAELVNPPNTKVGPEDFQLLKVLGKGG
uniref:Triokinase/FMN cyclase n=1 Tax=Globodera pallida TaxID=36090 RepID=A0A183BT02_GLOPA